MLDQGVSREFQFSGLLLIVLWEKKIPLNCNATNFLESFFFFLRNYYKGNIYSKFERSIQSVKTFTLLL